MFKLVYKKIKPSIKKKKKIVITQEEDCSICLSEKNNTVYLIDENKRTCSHTFCKHCIESCTTKVCPICRQPFKSMNSF